MIVKVKIEKEFDTEEILASLNGLKGKLSDIEDKLILHDTIALVKELVTKLSLTKEALDKANGTKTEEKQNKKKPKKKPSCFGEYDPEDEFVEECHEFCDIEEECKKETEERNKDKWYRRGKEVVRKKAKIKDEPIKKQKGKMPSCFGNIYRNDIDDFTCAGCEHIYKCKEESEKPKCFGSFYEEEREDDTTNCSKCSYIEKCKELSKNE